MSYHEKESRKWPVTEHGSHWRLHERPWWARPVTRREALLLCISAVGVAVLAAGYWMGW